jgi:acyl carrier protein
MSDILHISLAVAGFILVLGIATVIINRRLRRLAAERSADSICSFARSLDYRHLDTQVIRAAYEEIQRYLESVSPRFPIRTTDRLEQDLHMDYEDAVDIAISIAKRCKRDLQPSAAWPRERRLQTVADVIYFVCDLPKSHVA